MSNLIYLDFKNGNTTDDMMSFIACGHCHNKTYTLTDDDQSKFALMRCAACGNHIGRIGWVPVDEA